MTDKAPGQNTVTIVDIPGESKIGAIDLGPHRRPHGIDFDPSTGHVLVTTELPGALLILDPVKRTVIDTYDVRGRAPHMVRLAPDRHTAFVTCTDTSNLAIMDLKKGETIVLPTGPRPQGIAFSRISDEPMCRIPTATP